MAISRRRQIVLIASLLGFVGAAVPIAAMSWLSYRLSRQQEATLLGVIAETALDKASRTFLSARETLDAVEQSAFTPCSYEHIALMRDMTINSPHVEEIGYFADDLLQCTSWGIAKDSIRRQPADFTTPDGLPATLRVKPSSSASGRLTAVYKGNYGVLINPASLTDLAAGQFIDIVLLTERGKVVSQHLQSGSLSDAIAAGTRNVIADNSMSVVQNRGSIFAVVIDRDPKLAIAGSGFMLVLVPIGILLGGLLSGAVFSLAKRRLSPQAELLSAIKGNELVVFYQPIIELRSGICVGAEALVRWRKSDGSLIGPDEFIPLAEETGLISSLTDKVIDIVLSELGEQLAKDRTLHIAINVSAADIQSGRIVDTLDEKLKQTSIRKEQIWLEATERGFIDIRTAQTTLERARRAGHSVAIDDFGTGYSSLQYLHGLPLDALKIDKSFVKSINKDSATSTVTLHIIEMARELSLFTVAEGVETREQSDFLIQHGVDFVQGWLYSKPLPSGGFVRFQKENSRQHGEAPEIIRAHSQAGDDGPSD